MFQIIVRVFILALAIFLANCNRITVTANERVTGQQTGTLQGQVHIGPNCPVENADGCERDAEVYAAHQLAVLDSNQQPVKELVLDASGNFRTDLEPGSYFADVVPQDVGIGKQSDPLPFTIQAGETTSISIEIDTGIR